MRLWKKKLPKREDKPYHEANKIGAKVLDNYTLEILIKLLNSKIIKSMDYSVSSGKEASLFRATTPEGTYLAVKVFKFETSALRNMGDYIDGDPRFAKVRRSKRSLVIDWASKEFANLRAAKEAGVDCPEPFKVRGNVVIMEFEGVDGKPYGLLENVVLKDPDGFFNKLLLDLRKLYAIGLVHADLSPYNILVRQEKDGGPQSPIIIDWGQAVVHEHPKAAEFLERDVTVLCKYFSRLGVQCDAADVLKELKAIPVTKKHSHR